MVRVVSAPSCSAPAAPETELPQQSFGMGLTHVCSELTDRMSIGPRDTGHHHQERHAVPDALGHWRGLHGHMLHRRGRLAHGLRDRQGVCLLHLPGEARCGAWRGPGVCPGLQGWEGVPPWGPRCLGQRASAGARLTPQQPPPPPPAPLQQTHGCPPCALVSLSRPGFRVSAGWSPAVQSSVQPLLGGDRSHSHCPSESQAHSALQDAWSLSG